MSDRAPRAFTLLEALTALAISAGVLLGAIAAFTSGVREAGLQKHEFEAFSIAQQQIEVLSSVRPGSALLDNVSPGDVHDPSTAVGIDGPALAKRKVNEFGQADAAGEFEVYWKIEAVEHGVSDIVVYVRRGSQVVSIETFR